MFSTRSVRLQKVYLKVDVDPDMFLAVHLGENVKRLTENQQYKAKYSNMQPN